MAVASQINLAKGQYGNKIVEGFHRESFIGNRYSNEFEFTGSKGITLLSTVTQPLHNYGLSDDLTDVVNGKIKVTRFGPLNEVEDERQDLVMGQSSSFNMTIEKQNQSDQMMLKTASNVLAAQIREKVTPMVDRHTLHKWIEESTPVTGPALTKTTIVAAILKAETAMFNAGVPERDRFLYIPASMYANLRLATEFLQGPEPSFIKKSIGAGKVGMIGSFTVIRIPDSYLVNTVDSGNGTWNHSNIDFLAVYKGSVIRPFKIKTQRVITDSELLDGWLLQGHYYFDAFVLQARFGGIYAYGRPSN
jgi:hypothetical protein